MQTLIVGWLDRIIDILIEESMFRNYRVMYGGERQSRYFDLKTKSFLKCSSQSGSQLVSCEAKC